MSVRLHTGNSLVRTLRGGAHDAVHGIWLAPLVLSLRTGSLWAVAPACLFAAGMAVLLRPAGEMPRSIHPSVVVALLLQSAVVTAGTDQPMLSALFAAAGCFAWSFAWPIAWIAEIPVAPRIILAVSLAAVVLTPYRTPPVRGGDSSTPPSESSPAPPTQKPLTPYPSGESLFNGGHRGVILLPEAEPYTILVPPLPAMRLDRLGSQSREPLRIPFYGAYWIYQAPATSPPSDSIRVRGKPTTKSFRSVEHIPLTVEARQNFSAMLPVSCCSRIEVHVSNADPYMGTLDLELILRNTAMPARPFVSLGLAPIRSSPRWSPGRKERIYAETLSFSMPANLPFTRFDEAVFRFHMQHIRAEKSPRVAIERIVLVP